MDDADLQDEPLQIRIMDHDTYSGSLFNWFSNQISNQIFHFKPNFICDLANDAIGKVNISLNPLLLPSLDASVQLKSGKGAVMQGWLPVYDTMRGIQGEINIIVKVELFSDVNKFRQSSCGVQFFHCMCRMNRFAISKEERKFNAVVWMFQQMLYHMDIMLKSYMGLLKS